MKKPISLKTEDSRKQDDWKMPVRIIKVDERIRKEQWRSFFMNEREITHARKREKGRYTMTGEGKKARLIRL
jgi:hypothetical protein